MSTGEDRVRSEEAPVVGGGFAPATEGVSPVPVAGAPIPPTAPAVEKYPVVLVIPGVGPRKFNVLPGTTVEDVIREAGVTTDGQDVMISNTRVDGTHVITASEKVIFMVPRPKNAADEYWAMVAQLLVA